LWITYVVRRYAWVMWISYPQKMWISFGTQLALWKMWISYPQ
jgi:hypothetical protein